MNKPASDSRDSPRWSLHPRWEKIFSVKQSRRRQATIGLMIGLIGFAVVSAIHEVSGYYYSSIAIVTVVFISLNCEFLLAILFASALSLACDYFYLIPTGTVLSDRGSFEHLLILTLLSAFISWLGSSLRLSFQASIESKRQAIEATGLMEKTLALISHDVRNPLSAIRLNTQVLLRAKDLNSQMSLLLNRTIKTVDFADTMIQSLLDVSSMRAGKLIQLQFKKCDLGVELKELESSLTAQVGDRVRIQVDGSFEGEWGWIGIRRAVENLVTNAAKYGSAGTPITISLKRSAENAMLSVHNEGPEIPVAHQAGLFETFRRTPDAESSSVRGWGIGLSLVKGIAEAHGGSVSVESRAGEGTRFILVLPMLRSPHG